MTTSTTRVAARGDSRKLSQAPTDQIPDVTPMKQTEAKLNAGALRYRQLIEMCQDGIFLTIHDRIVRVNRAGAIMLGGADRTEQLIGRPLQDFLPLDPHSAQPQEFGAARVENEGGSCPGQHKLQRLDGCVIEVEVITAPYQENDEPGCLVIMRDISRHNPTIARLSLHDQYLRLTRLRRTEQQLHRREREFKTLVENSPDGISRIDRNMRHIYVNPATEALTGLHAADYLGKTKAELDLPPALVRAWDTAARAAFNSGTEQRFEFELGNGGRTRYFSARLIPEPDRDGNVESILGITYDVTDRTKMEKEHELLLARERAARIQAETAARARDEFLAIVSHELRAPLNGIQSWAHILENYVKDSTSGPLAQRALNGIKTGVAQQVRLIEDLLDVTRMMSGKLRLVKQPFTILPVIQAAVESVRDAAAARHIGVTCTYQITTEQINGDSDRVQQVIWNLLSNAVKFTPHDGNIWLTAACVDSQIAITVRDDGAGISPDFLPHLFDRFSQEDTSSTRGHSGLGLGLFLVRHLIELHGGAVKAESPGEGRGTTFSVHLPLRTRRDRYVPAAQTEAGDSPVPLPSLKGLRILLIDDQEEARESLTMVLATAGASVFSAASSREVLEWLPTAELNELPDILVCDIAMPVEDGYSALRKLRTWETANGFAPLHRLPALALTAFAQREDRIRALTAGFHMHMTKPVAPEELIVVIAMMASRG